MEYIEGNDGAFETLLSSVGIEPLGKPEVYRYNGEECNEMQLKPTKKHLMALVDIMATKDHGSSDIKNENRRALFCGASAEREDACKRAKRELEEKYGELTSSSRAWFVFEGFTNPDIFIEGEDFVIVCEGKWTEPHITTVTTHLSGAGEYRNQMIRHIQGALNYTSDTGKRVYAFYIVDGENPEMTVSETFIKNDAGEPIYCSEKLVKHEESGTFGGTAFDVGMAKLYEQLYYKITEGKPMEVTPEMAAQIISVIETVHAQNPMPLKF